MSLKNLYVSARNNCYKFNKKSARLILYFHKSYSYSTVKFLYRNLYLIWSDQVCSHPNIEGNYLGLSHISCNILPSLAHIGNSMSKKSLRCSFNTSEGWGEGLDCLQRTLSSSNQSIDSFLSSKVHKLLLFINNLLHITDKVMSYHLIIRYSLATKLDSIYFLMNL